MKISLNWIQSYLNIDKSPTEIAEILTSLGLEVEGLEAVKPSPVDLDRVLTGRVVQCERIPDTDHLSATQVDAGDGQMRSVVCGAPNVAAGQIVFLALPGAQVFSKDGQLFQIAERKVRGVPSQGMICAQDELGIGHDHSGIMVLPSDTPLGLSAAEYLRQEQDTIIEIGLTPNRADATNHLGVCRDLAAYLRVHEPDTLPMLRLPDVGAFPDVSAAPYPVVLENPEACPRYSGVLIEGVSVQESPDWLKSRLSALGIRPINNVVDITNFVRAETGQPLHAFDADQIPGNRIRVKTLPEGTIFTTLDEQERTLSADDLMICGDDETPLCMGGVFGGAHSGVSDRTDRIFLESANFHPKWIRRSMLRHNLRTDAAWTFEKGVDPEGTIYALKRAALLILELAGGQISTGLTDIYPKPVEKVHISVRYERVNRLIGEELSAENIKNILQALEIGIEAETAEGLIAIIPGNKPDVTREADVVEEILRIYGLDRIRIPSQFRTSMEISKRPSPDSVRNLAADFLAAAGYHEAMSLALSNSGYYTGEGAMLPFPPETLAYVHNTANQGLDCLRPTLLFNALEAVARNQNRQSPDLRLFEFGKSFRRQSAEHFEEVQRLCILLTGAHRAESWQPQAKKQVDYYTLKSAVHLLLNRLGVGGYQESVIQAPPFQYAMKYHRGPHELVVFGAVQPAILKKMDIKNPVFYAEFHFDNVFTAATGHTIRFAELNKFPVVRRDLALVIDQQVQFSEIRQLANKTVKKLLREVNLFDVFEDEQKLGSGKKSYALSFHFEDPEKTLQDKEIDEAMLQLQQAFEKNLNALIRK